MFVLMVFAVSPCVSGPGGYKDTAVLRQHIRDVSKILRSECTSAQVSLDGSFSTITLGNSLVDVQPNSGPKIQEYHAPQKCFEARLFKSSLADSYKAIGRNNFVCVQAVYNGKIFNGYLKKEDIETLFKEVDGSTNELKEGLCPSNVDQKNNSIYSELNDFLELQSHCCQNDERQSQKREKDDLDAGCQRFSPSAVQKNWTALRYINGRVQPYRIQGKFFQNLANPICLGLEGGINKSGQKLGKPEFLPLAIKDAEKLIQKSKTTPRCNENITEYALKLPTKKNKNSKEKEEEEKEEDYEPWARDVLVEVQTPR